jgi:hypothetical protein
MRGKFGWVIELQSPRALPPDFSPKMGNYHRECNRFARLAVLRTSYKPQQKGFTMLKRYDLSPSASSCRDRGSRVSGRRASVNAACGIRTCQKPHSKLREKHIEADEAVHPVKGELQIHNLRRLVECDCPGLP